MARVDAMENNGQSISEDTSRFLQLIAMFQMAAMQQMGKLPNPATNEVECDLQQAKASIDVLETIKRKTEGNLIEAEAEFLDKILFELRMNYVDEANRATKEKEDDAGEAAEAGAESPEDSAESPEDSAESSEGSGVDPDDSAQENEK